MAYNCGVKFEWDTRKNERNYRKHGIWFEEAQTVWVDPNSSEFFDPEHSDNEDRFLRLGSSTLSRYLLVVFCEREEGGAVRIISARRMTTKERKQYEKGI
jgi:uncharacterized DUF497 family protein